MVAERKQVQEILSLNSVLSRYFASVLPNDIPGTASEVLSKLQEECKVLRREQEEVRDALVQTAERALGERDTSTYAPTDVREAAALVTVLHEAAVHVEGRSHHEALLREAERALTDATQLAQASASGPAPAEPHSPFAHLDAAQLGPVLECLQTAVGAFRQAVSREVKSRGLPPARLEHAGRDRQLAVLTNLRQAVTAALQRAMAVTRWLEEGPEGTVEQAQGEGAACLQCAVELLCSLQVAAGVEPAAELWACEQLLAPAVQRALECFRPGGAALRPDRPEWLFAYALKLIRSCSPVAARVLGRGLEAAYEGSGRSHGVSPSGEVAQCLSESIVCALLHSHLLPDLEDRPLHLWAHAGREAVGYDRAVAAVMEPSQAAPVGHDHRALHEVAAAAPRGGLTATGAFAGEARWLARWAEAELAEALRKLDKAWDSPGAWAQPGDAGADADVAALGESDLELEFNPPAVALGVMAVVRSVAEGCCFVPEAEQRARFLEVATVGVLDSFQGRLQRFVEPVRAFKDLTAQAGLTRVARCVSAARFLEHSLQEVLSEPLFLTLLDGGGSDLFAAPAAALRTFCADCVARVAAAVGQNVSDAAAPYRANVAQFRAGGAGGAADVSALVCPALDRAQGHLATLKRHLDRRSFTATWRAAAQTLNLAFFNDLASTATFTPAGAEQFTRDCEALVSLWRPYTPRPANFFKELMDACKLLTLPPEESTALAEMLGGCADDMAEGEAAQLAAELRRRGIRKLSPEQAATVLSS